MTGGGEREGKGDLITTNVQEINCIREILIRKCVLQILYTSYLNIPKEKIA